MRASGFAARFCDFCVTVFVVNQLNVCDRLRVDHGMIHEMIIMQYS